MTLESFNQSDKHTKAAALVSCCSSERWVAALLEKETFDSLRQLVQQAIACWYDECTEADWLEAFAHHPKIGDKGSLKEKFAGQEQKGITTATDKTIEALMQANKSYEEENGFIFIVCATGKSAGEMLALMEDRLRNSRQEELHIAMGEQMKISIIRLQQLLNMDEESLQPCQLTSHVLDTSVGKPGKGINIHLLKSTDAIWRKISTGITNNDGRLADLLPPERLLPKGDYKLVFSTGDYFKKSGVETFYPEVQVHFSITDDSHYHIPLLINPYGYSTYRGS